MKDNQMTIKSYYRKVVTMTIAFIAIMLVYGCQSIQEKCEEAITEAKQCIQQEIDEIRKKDKT